ncbi:MAG: SUMF1/EgtB/PvdO family nonheme iron enzyme [Pyrinomonadaceae bacterium]|nr:SUMF1/EgtB/PvdO family nonheme iron enzyme [Pyrinomonadaceae bacterium]
MKRILLPIAILLFSVSSFANGLKIENIRYLSKADTKGDVFVVFDLHWKNAWKNARNNDAAWVFFKFPGRNGDRHAKVAANGHSQIDLFNEAASGIRFDVPDERTGLYVSPFANFRGDVSWRVKVRLETEGLDDRLRSVPPKVFGVEMVYIPKGPFSLGDKDPKATDYGAFYKSDSAGAPDGHIRIDSEAAIAVGPNSGSLYYKKATYVGDQSGPVPATFPKGFESFYLMKYELTQGQYAEFLNSIPDSSTFSRSNFVGRSYYQNKGTIRLEGNEFIAGKPERPMNFMTWDDGLAFADWAGLRPMTELEFTKAARGPGLPGRNEFPWGTADTDQIARIVNSNNDLTMARHLSESDLNDETLPIFGASEYWVMDLAGSVWERVITIGSADGRAFTGSTGDGNINSKNDDWPYNDAGKKGHGYRGGGFYHQRRSEHEFNPYSPIAYRRFGGWSGGDAHMAYGFRCAGNAPSNMENREGN